MEQIKIFEMLILASLAVISFFLREIHKDFRKMQLLLQTLKEEQLVNHHIVVDLKKRVDKIEKKIQV